MKKFSTLTLVIVLVLTLSACMTSPNKTDEIHYSSVVHTPDIPVSNGEWDEILLNCDNEYFVVGRTFQARISRVYEVGIVDKDSNWICVLSNSNILAEFMNNEAGQIVINGGKTSVGSKNFYYLGSGVVVASLGVTIKTESGEEISVGGYSPLTNSGFRCYFYNIEEKNVFYHNASSISTVIDGNIIIDENIVIRCSDWTRVADAEGFWEAIKRK